MSILKQVLTKDVKPAMGCTEPGAIAWGASIARQIIDLNLGTCTLKQIRIITDPGVFKNGIGVKIPNSGGQKGNAIAAALGYFGGNPENHLQVLNFIEDTARKEAIEFIDSDRLRLECDHLRDELYIHILVRCEGGESEVLIQGHHTNLVLASFNGILQQHILDQYVQKDMEIGSQERINLQDLSLEKLVEIANRADFMDLDWIEEGIRMNLDASRQGEGLGLLGSTLKEMISQGVLSDDLFNRAEVVAASATDARMNGVSCPVMSSGGSGNQGIVAILVPWIVGDHQKVSREKILKSIALSHLINAQMKCFTGELSPMCGCSIAAGVGAAVAIVYQQRDDDVEAMGKAINCICSDVAGMLCDGAKGGCSLKVASAARAAIRAGLLAIRRVDIPGQDGIVGKTPHDTLKNLGLLSRKGMLLVNDTCISLMHHK